MTDATHPNFRFNDLNLKSTSVIQIIHINSLILVHIFFVHVCALFDNNHKIHMFNHCESRYNLSFPFTEVI